MLDTWRAFKNGCKRFFDFSSRRSALYAAWNARAEAGDEEAKYKLLRLYQDADPKLYPLVFKWTLDVAKQGGDCCALMQAAQMLEAGHGTPKDDAQALVWFERALSLHILRGRKSSLSVNASNYLQERIQTLRTALGRE